MVRDGVSYSFHWSLPRSYARARVKSLVRVQHSQGSGHDEVEEAQSLRKKKVCFGKCILDNVHGEAHHACQDLMTVPEALTAQDSYKMALRLLQTIEKVGVIDKGF